MMVSDALESWQTARLPKAQRWDAWRDVLNATHLPWSVEPRTPGDRFDAAMAWRQSRDLSFVTCRCQPCAGRRTAAEIRATERPSFGLLFILEGSEAVRQGEVSALLKPGDLFLWDSERPLDFEIRAPLSKITLMIPKDEAAQLRCGRRVAPLHLSAAQPEALLLSGFLTSLSRTMSAQAAASWQASQRSALDLLETAVAAKETADPLSRREALRRAVEADIDRLARDPALTPCRLAERHGVSTRYLHMLFEEETLSLSARIRAVRLEGARRDLLAAPQREVTEIAFAWGFNSAAHFSRCFKQRFGSAPSLLRTTQEQSRQ